MGYRARTGSRRDRNARRPRDTVDVRCPDQRVSVATETGIQVVGGDEQDVPPLARPGDHRRGPGRYSTQTETSACDWHWAILLSESCGLSLCYPALPIRAVGLEVPVNGAIDRLSETISGCRPGLVVGRDLALDTTPLPWPGTGASCIAGGQPLASNLRRRFGARTGSSCNFPLSAFRFVTACSQATKHQGRGASHLRAS
jgi:hypothetical protein